MKKLAMLIVGGLLLISLSGCVTRTVYVPYPLPPSLTASVIEPYLIGDDNDALHRYAQECRTELRLCNSQLKFIREIQEIK